MLVSVKFPAIYKVSEVLSKDELFVKFPAIWISEDLGVKVELFSKFPLIDIFPVLGYTLLQVMIDGTLYQQQLFFLLFQY